MAAIALGEMLDAGRRRHGEVDRLARGVGEPAQRFARELDERPAGNAALREPQQDGPGLQAPCALNQSLSLERGHEPRRRALRQPAQLGELADRERPGALDHADEQLAGPVDRLGAAVLAHIVEQMFHTYSSGWE